MDRKKLKSFEEFRRMAESEDGVSFIPPPAFRSFGLLIIYQENGAWIVRDSARAPDDVVGQFNSFDELLSNLKSKDKTLRDVWQEIEVFIDDEP